MRLRLWKRKKGPKRSVSTRLFHALAVKEFSRSLLFELHLEAKRESLAYVNEKMRGLPYFKDGPAILQHALESVTVAGQYLEFGVAGGRSIKAIARSTDSLVHGFDSFQGLPEAWNGNPIGRFRQARRLPKVPDNVRLHSGYFADTLPRFFAEHREPIAFMHVDCDLYSSTRTVFQHAGPRTVAGTVVLFDEYFNYPHWKEHEFKAFQEFVREHSVRYRYLSFSATRNQVAAVILENPSARQEPS